jgi:hypothetical protein
MRGVTANRRRTADTPNLAAQEQSVSRKTVAEVPLTGLSFLWVGYHWNCNAETYYLIGDGMGKATVELLGGPKTPPNPTGPSDKTGPAEKK